jgi:thiamine biosynthesis protein ThiI
VSVRRINRTIPQETIELQRLLGGAILTQISGLSVDVRHPELELNVEIRDEGAYFYHKIKDGAGGFPIGSNGKAMIMLSGGIDSPVAAWLAMRKGLALEAVHFHSYPYTSDRAKQKVIDLARRLSVYSGSIKLHLVPFTEIQLKLREQGQANLLITFMRRAMLRITEKLAQREVALGIVTGESLGQVASQTLSSLNTIGQVATLPLLRPLLMMDKMDIIQIAERIETYPISILPYEDCCTLFVPPSSSTNPNLKVVTRMEQRMTWLEDEMLRAIEQTESLLIKPNESKFSSFF